MGAVIKVLIPGRHRAYKKSACDGHRAEHLAGDPSGMKSAGVGIWLTGPPTWLVYAAPNEFTHPFVISMPPLQATGLKSKVKTAKGILEQVDPRDVETQRKRMPGINCERCEEPTPLFFVSDEEWARVGRKWAKKLLCRECYDEMTT